ncbi:MAG: hypothetical protein WC708_15390 [Lentisphaeria bacterium]
MAAVRLYKLDETADLLKVNRKQIVAQLPACAPEFAKRGNHRLTQDEFDRIAAAVAKDARK